MKGKIINTASDYLRDAAGIGIISVASQLGQQASPILGLAGAVATTYAVPKYVAGSANGRIICYGWGIINIADQIAGLLGGNVYSN